MDPGEPAFAIDQRASLLPQSEAAARRHRAEEVWIDLARRTQGPADKGRSECRNGVRRLHARRRARQVGPRHVSLQAVDELPVLIVVSELSADERPRAAHLVAE